MLWASLFAVVAIAIAVLVQGLSALSTPRPYLSGLLTICVYILGLQARDRTTAVVAGAIMSCSPGAMIAEPLDAAFILCTLLALIASVANKPAVAILLAGLATALRTDGVLLGAVLLVLALSDKTPRAALLIFLYIAVGLFGWVLSLTFLHRPVHNPEWNPTTQLLTYFFLGGAGLIGWFIFPFLADLAEPARWNRWKPLVLWVFLYLPLESLIHLDSGQRRQVLEPFLIVMGAGGFARLLPVIASDFMTPRSRYVLATAAVATLAIVKAHTDWPKTQALLKPATAIAPAPAVKQESHAVKPEAAAPPKPVVPVKPAIAAKPVTAAAIPSPVAVNPTAVTKPAAAVKPAAPAKPAGAAKPTATAKPAAVAAAAAIPGAALVAAINHAQAGTSVPVHSPSPQPHAPAPQPHVPSPPAAVPHHVIIVNASEIHETPGAKPGIPTSKPVPAKPAPVVHKPAAPLTQQQALAAEAAAYGVPMTHRERNGRIVERTRWAILWDIKGRKAAGVKPRQPHPVATPAAHPAAAKLVGVKPQAPKAVPHAAAKPPVKAIKPVAKRPVHAPAKPAWRRPAHPPVKRWVKPRKRSIWAIRWERTHPRKR